MLFLLYLNIKKYLSVVVFLCMSGTYCMKHVSVTLDCLNNQEVCKNY